MANLDDYMLRIKIEFLKNVSKINKEDGTPFFDKKWLLENMLGIKNNIYCPDCLNSCTQYNDNTLAPVCSCGWTGNMSDLLTEKEMNKELRRRKINNINNIL